MTRCESPTAAPGGPAAGVDPRILRSRRLVIEAATAEFLLHGYRVASVDGIAERAGVSKRTVYNLYGDKERLFRATLEEAVETAERFSRDVVADLGGRGDAAEELRRTGLGLARAVLGGRIIPLRRLLIAEAARFPAIAADYYERAPARVMASLGDAMRRYGRRGVLAIDDPDMAAEHFAFLVIGASLDRALFDASGRSPSAPVVEARAEAGVRAFLRAYAPGRDGGAPP